MGLAGKFLGTEDGNVLGAEYPLPEGRLLALNNTIFGRYFRLNERKSTVMTEIRAGLVTFLTMAYIISVNANILTVSGGPCSSQDCTGDDKSFACRFDGPGGFNPGYQTCLDQTRKSLITATSAATCIACFIMGVMANMPIALSCSMGLNAYFTYVVVQPYGTGNVTYNQALAAIFIEGWIFVLLSVSGVRQYIIKLLPRSLALSMSAGIGLFLAYIGLQAGEGIGVVSADSATLSTLGACPVNHRLYTYTIADPSLNAVCTNLTTPGTPNIGPASSAYVCDGHKMTDAAFWLGISGFAIMCVLMSRGFKGAIIVGVLWVTIISWIPGHAASYLGDTSDQPGGIGNNGNDRWHYFKKVVAAPSISKTAVQLDFAGMGNGNVWVALITFLYVDFSDCTGTLFSMANFVNNYIPGYIDEKKNFPRSIWAYCTDGFSIVVGSLMGISPITAFIESATGIREGGRTGITACVTGSCFFVALFFAPLLASIPVYATGVALIIVGALMMVNAAKVDWHDMTQSIPAFLTIVLMPLTYSIAYGVIGGVISYFLFYVVTKALDWGSDRCGGWLGYNRPNEHHDDGREARELTFRIHNTHNPAADPSDTSEGDDSQRNAKINNILNKDVELSPQERV